MLSRYSGIVVLDLRDRDGPAVDAAAAEAATVARVAVDVVGEIEAERDVARDVVPVGLALERAVQVEVGARRARRVEQILAVRAGQNRLVRDTGRPRSSSGVWLATRVAVCVNSFSSFVYRRPTPRCHAVG